MPRITITVPNSVYKDLGSLAVQSGDSMSNLASRLIAMGLHSMNDEGHQKATPVEAHCHYLVIQMNALIKNLSVEILKYDQDDFERLKHAAEMKYNELYKLIKL